MDDLAQQPLPVSCMNNDLQKGLSYMSDVYDLLIIGAGPAGLTAAIYAGRSKMSVLVVDSDEPGGQMRITSEVTNYPGILRAEGIDLAEDMKQQALSFSATIIQAKVVGVDFREPIKQVFTEDGRTLRSVGVIIATGAKPKKAGFEGELEFSGRGVGYCATCDGAFFEGMDIFVVGGSYSAAEEALYLTRYADKVALIVRGPRFTCPQSIVDKVMNHPKIDVHFNTQVVSVGGDTVLKHAKFINSQTKKTWEYTLSGEFATFGVFVFVGFVPSSEVFQGQVATDEAGYIITDDTLMTDMDCVFAAGDIRPKKLRQITTAVSDGSLAAIHAEKRIEEIKAKLKITTITVATQEAAKHEEPVSLHPTESALDEGMKNRLRELFGQFDQKVTVVGILEAHGTDTMNKLSVEVASFLGELSGLHEKVAVQIYPKGEQVALEEQLSPWSYPVMTLLDAQGHCSRVSYYGVPSGHEFDAFIGILRDVAGSGQPIEPTVLERISKIDKPFHLQTCVLHSCQFCPGTVTACHQIARNNDAITSEMVDIAQYPQLQREHNIMSVPVVVINGEHALFGAKSLVEILSELEKQWDSTEGL